MGDLTVLRKIQKLLDRASKDDGTEGMLAAEIAARLMIEHAVSMIDVSSVDQQDSIAEHCFSIKSRAMWGRLLATSVAEYCNCRCTYRTSNNSLQFYGYRSDAEIAEYLFHVFFREITSRAEQYMKERNIRNDMCRVGGEYYRMSDLAPSQKSSIRLTFCSSAVSTLSERLRDMKKKVQEDNTSTTAIVLSRADAVTAWFEDHVKVRHSTYNFNWNAAGEQAGRDINIVNGIAGGSTTRQLG